MITRISQVRGLYANTFCRSVIAATCLFAASNVFAEESLQLSLPELLARAQKQANLVQHLDAITREAELKLAQVNAERWLNTLEFAAFTGVVPDVNANSAVANRDANQLLFRTESSDFENGFSVSDLGPFVQMNLKAVQPLWTGGKISGYEKMAKENIAISESEKRKQMDQVRFLVKKSYYTYLFSLEATQILEEVRTKLAQAEEQVEELLIKNAENVEENDRLKIKVFQADVENRSLDAVKGKRLALAALAELTGVLGEWQPKEANLDPEVVNGIEKQDVISKALRAKPELMQLDSLIEVKKGQKKTLKADLYPDIFVAGELKYAYAPGRTDVKSPYLNDTFNTFGMGVALGLKQDLGFHRHVNKVQQVEAEIARLTAQRARLGSLVRIQTEEAFEKAVGAQQGIEINENGFRAARSWLTSVGLAFSLGTAPTKDVLESYAAYFKARVDLIRSIYELNLALSELSQSSGLELVDRLKGG